MGVSKIDMTIKHILTHTSGFGSLKEAKLTNEAKKTANKTVEYFIKQGLDFEPFSNEAYSTIASFDLLSLVLERVTGESFSDFIKREILEPCNMNNTTYVPNENEWTRIIDMHNRKKGYSGKNSVISMPVWAFHGVEDSVVSVTQSDEMISKLKEFNADVVYSRINGVGHNVWEKTYDKELIEWLLSKRRNK